MQDTREEIKVEFERYKYGTQVNGGIDNENDCYRFLNAKNDQFYFYEAKDNFEMLSAIDNKGFYIGRYETGSNTQITSSAMNATPIVKPNVYVYNNVTKSKAKQLADSFVTGDNVDSRLCSSYAWDTALKFIEKTGNANFVTNSTQGNYNSTVMQTGKTTAVKNIYDLGGNVYEWTTEVCSNASAPCTARGGAINTTPSNKPASSRTAIADTASGDTGFRIALFLQTNS